MSSMRPLPVINELNKPFFDGLNNAQLLLQRCTACGHLRYPLAAICPECLNTSSTWERMSGRGKVHSTVVFHQVYNDAFADQVPYNVAIVELDEGPRLMSNVVGIAPDAVTVEQRVEVVFTKLRDDICIPQFAPVGEVQ